MMHGLNIKVNILTITNAIKRHLLTIALPAALLAPFLIISEPAQANNDSPFFGQYAAWKWTTGAKAATVQKGADGFKDWNATGLVLGYEFARPIGYDGSVSIEIELL